MSEDTTDVDEDVTGRPWSARKPQSLVLSAIFIVLAIALVWQAFQFIDHGIGGAIPYILIIGGPGMSAFYIWYFNFRNFEEDQQQAAG